MKRLINLYSQDKEQFVFWSDETTTRQDINEFIINYLKSHPKDVIELCKEYSPRDQKKHYGQEIISFYAINPKTGNAGQLIERNGKTYYRPLIHQELQF